jgi:hypothetical protein
VSTIPARLQGVAVAVATVALAAIAVPLDAAPAGAVGPTVTRASVVYTADTNGDFHYGVYAAPAANPNSRTAIVAESPSLDVISNAVSPDGAKIAAEVDRVGNGDYSLEVIDVATGAHSVLVPATHTTNFASGYGVDGYDFSRDGSTIVYSQSHWSTSPGGTRSFTDTLFTRPADASAAATAVTGGAGLAYPAYSQDGTKLAASNLQGAAGGLYILDPGTGTSTKLAAAASGMRFRNPTWSPDDTSIVASLADLRSGAPVATTSNLLLFDPNLSASQTPAHVSPAGNTHLDFQRPYFAMDGSLWSDVIDSANCCSGDLFQAHKNSGGGWTMSDRTPTAAVDEGDVVSPRPVDDGAPTQPVTLGAVGLAGAKLVVRWTVPAGLDDYSHVVLHRTGGGGPDTDIQNAFGTSYADTSAVFLGHTYTYTATVYDGSGNAGPVSTTSVTATASGVALTAPSPTSALYKQLPFTVAWGFPGQPSHPVITYDVKYAVKGGSSWALGAAHSWYSGTTLSHATFAKGVPGQTYYFQATVHDDHGNVSSTSWKGFNVPLDQKSGSFSRGWGTISNSQYWLGSIASTATNGASVTFTTTSKSEALIGERCPTCAMFAVYVDGHYRGTFNSFSGSSATKHRQVLWGWVNNRIGRHTIKIVAVLPKGRVLRVDGLANPR